MNNALLRIISNFNEILLKLNQIKKSIQISNFIDLQFRENFLLKLLSA